MKKILTIDLSGTGTTGIFFQTGPNQEFYDFYDKDWEEHLKFLVSFIREKQPQIIIYEHTNYVNLHGKDMTFLFKLFGGIKTLPYVFDFLEKVDYLPVHQVKSLKNKIYQKTKQIEGLIYKIGRGGGWIYRNQRLSLHKLDALLLYHLWEEKNKEN